MELVAPQTAHAVSSGKLQTVHQRTKAKKKRFLELFAESRGNISKLCMMVRISRETFYVWRKEDTHFADALADIRMSLNDEMEDALLEKALVQKDGASIRYYLDRRHPDYHPKGWNIPEKDGLTLEDLMRADARAES